MLTFQDVRETVGWDNLSPNQRRAVRDEWLKEYPEAVRERLVAETEPFVTGSALGVPGAITSAVTGLASGMTLGAWRPGDSGYPGEKERVAAAVQEFPKTHTVAGFTGMTLPMMAMPNIGLPALTKVPLEAGGFTGIDVASDIGHGTVRPLSEYAKGFAENAALIGAFHALRGVLGRGKTPAETPVPEEATNLPVPKGEPYSGALAEYLQSRVGVSPTGTPVEPRALLEYKGATSGVVPALAEDMRTGARVPSRVEPYTARGLSQVRILRELPEGATERLTTLAERSAKGEPTTVVLTPEKSSELGLGNEVRVVGIDRGRILVEADTGHRAALAVAPDGTIDGASSILFREPRSVLPAEVKWTPDLAYEHPEVQKFYNYKDLLEADYPELTPAIRGIEEQLDRGVVPKKELRTIIKSKAFKRVEREGLELPSEGLQAEAERLIKEGFLSERKGKIPAGERPYVGRLTPEETKTFEEWIKKRTMPETEHKVVKSYYAQEKRLPPEQRGLNIDTRAMKGFRTYKPLVPEKRLLSKLRRGEISVEEFKAKYLEQLSRLDREKVLADINGRKLVTWAGPKKFQHSSIVAEWLGEKGPRGFGPQETKILSELSSGKITPREAFQKLGLGTKKGVTKEDLGQWLSKQENLTPRQKKMLLNYRKLDKLPSDAITKLERIGARERQIQAVRSSMEILKKHGVETKVSKEGFRLKTPEGKGLEFKTSRDFLDYAKQVERETVLEQVKKYQRVGEYAKC